MNYEIDVQTEWEFERNTFRGRLEALSVSMQLFCEQAKEIGFERILDNREDK